MVEWLQETNWIAMKAVTVFVIVVFAARAIQKVRTSESSQEPN